MRISFKAALAACGFLAVWALAPSSSMATISGTDHDLSSNAPGGQICVTCHTPHHAPNTKLLWNHTLSANNFSWSDATETSGGTTLPTNIQSWSGSTKLCLSCHDGTVEIGNTYEPSTIWDNTKITGDHQIATSSGDLKGNHPVAVPYPFNQAQNTYNGITTGANVEVDEFVATPTNVKIFTDPSASAPNNHGIECASCHDPHGTDYDDFLRDDLVGSALCLDCHAK